MPKSWSPLATKIAVSKYFYGDIANGLDPKAGGRESSVRQLVHRVTRTITDWGAKDGYFKAMAETFGEKVGKDPANRVMHFEPKSNILTLDGTQYRVHPSIGAEVVRLTSFFASPESVKTFKRGIGKLTTIWKSQAVMTPGFIIRNAQSNYALAQMHQMGDLVAWKKATDLVLSKTMKDTDRLLVSGVEWEVGALRKELAKHALSSDGAYREVAGKVDELGKLGKNLAGGKVAERVHGWNEKVEDIGRVAVYLQARGRGLAPEAAGAMVNTVLYDYSRESLTALEQGARDVLPFYIWMRRNIPAQVQHLLHDPAKLSKFNKMKIEGDEATGNSTKWGEMPKYMREMGAIPIPLPNGKKMYLNPNWGWQDIAKLESIIELGHANSEPLLKDLLASISPFIKIPAEVAFNTDSFFGGNIKRFDGDVKKAPQWASKLNDYFGGQPWWEALLKAGGSATNKKTGDLMVSPVFLKVVSGIPILANIGRMSESGDQQKGRLLSILGGLKVMPDQSAKWSDNRVYEDRTNIANAKTALKSIGVDIPKAKKPVKQTDIFAVAAKARKKASGF